MPRATRYLMKGYTYHLTHRCHKQDYLLRSRRERSAYRKWLRIGVERYEVPIYGYCIMSTHVHVVARADEPEAIAEMMKLASASTAQLYNKRQDRTGSFWEHPYHCTIIENGRHLLNCLRYVDLNPVRAGLVACRVQ